MLNYKSFTFIYSYQSTVPLQKKMTFVNLRCLFLTISSNDDNNIQMKKLSQINKLLKIKINLT